jgi:hypothetical protein
MEGKAGGLNRAVVVVPLLLLAGIGFTFLLFHILMRIAFRYGGGNSVTDGFIEAIGEYDEEKAFSLLTSGAQQAVVELCPDGTVLSCWEDLGMEDWGKYQSAWFIFGESMTTGWADGYDTHWDNRVLFVAIITEDEGGEQRVSAF